MRDIHASRRLDKGRYLTKLKGGYSSRFSKGAAARAARSALRGPGSGVCVDTAMIKL